MGPGEEGELPHVVALHQGEDEPHKTDYVPVEQILKYDEDEMCLFSFYFIHIGPL